MCLLTVKVFDSSSDIKDPQEYPERLRSFGRAAAGRIRELLRHARTVGVTWGNTLSQMIEGLASSSSHKQEPAIQFVPVCAELVRLEDTGIEYSSSRLAHRLSEVINHKQVEQLSLTGIPAFLPRYHGRERKDVELLHKYLIDNSPSYKKIFTDSELRLVERVDTVLTSVGSFGDLYPSRVKPELSMAWGADANKVEALILGDVGGVLIPKPNLGMQDRKLVEELNHMWTGLKMNHLERMARITSANKNRSAASGSGNVVVAVGARKAVVIYETVRLGLVNELIIDRALARALGQTVNLPELTFGGLCVD